MAVKKRKHKSLEDRLQDAKIQEQKLTLQKDIRDMQSKLKDLRRK
jgi:hypothetical protein